MKNIARKMMKNNKKKNNRNFNLKIDARDVFCLK